MPHQPTATLALGEYELQVLETITQHAIDAGALGPELYRVVVEVQRKVESARAELRIKRRRLAMQQAQEGGTPHATVVNCGEPEPEPPVDPDKTTTRLEPMALDLPPVQIAGSADRCRAEGCQVDWQECERKGVCHFGVG